MRLAISITCEVWLDIMASHWVMQVVLILIDNVLMNLYLPMCMFLVSLFFY